MGPRSYKKYSNNSLFTTEKKNDQNESIKPSIDAVVSEIEYKAVQRLILYQMRHQLDGIAIEVVRKELKDKCLSVYPNMVELYDGCHSDD